MKKLLLTVIMSTLVLSSIPVPVCSAASVDYSLWDKFLKYDLCITDYNALTEEEQELCHFIFDTEQAANDNIICERARRTLAGDTDLGKRITIGDLQESWGIWDKYSPNTIYGLHLYTHCVPDIIHLDDSAPFWYEYWLDDTGSKYVVFREKTSYDDYRCFDVFTGDGELLETITAAEPEMPFIDFRTDEKIMKDIGFIYKNGGWYYTKSDGTAVFAWCDYAESVQVKPEMYEMEEQPIEEPFIVEGEINGCPITSIECGAFEKAPLKKIVLPDTIEHIGISAFFNCSYLNEIELPKGLKYLGNSAFMYCTSLEEFDIDCPYLRLDPDTFNGCDNLSSMKLNVREIGERSVPRNLESLELGNAVRKIGYNSFGRCKKLESLEIPFGTEQICQKAFMYSGIKSVTIPPTVNVIGTYPSKNWTEHMLGMNDIPCRRPLTDTPICTFDSDCIIKGYRGTEAERYANEWGLEFEALEAETGDVNLDGEITVADAVALQRFLLGRYVATGAYYGDMNGDGTVDAFDMILIRKKLTEKV